MDQAPLSNAQSMPLGSGRGGGGGIPEAASWALQEAHGFFLSVLFSL